MKARIKMLVTAVFVGGVVFNAAAQIGSLSAVRSIGDTAQVLDLTISLHRPLSEIMFNPSLKNSYEETIRYWADGIYEMTNGGHKLGKIRIFTNKQFFDDVDVQWIDTIIVNNAPNSHINGFTYAGTRIEMADRFSGYNILRGTHMDWEGAGYTLAHESGHYIHALLDEYTGNGDQPYMPQPGDVAVEPSIMNDQWGARGGNYEWLNFSTSGNIGNLSKSAQGRVHGASAWTVLTRNPNNDPSTYTTYNLGRTQYPVLDNRAPSATNTYKNLTWMRVELDNPSGTTRARDSLQIIWMTDTIAIDLVLDRSGSMSRLDSSGRYPINELKLAASALIDVIYLYSQKFNFVPAIGITTFSDSAENIYPITVLDVSNIGDIKALINAIETYDMTAMYDACTSSVYKLLKTTTSSNRITMLFTDGNDNYSDINANGVIKIFNENNIPIYTFGYGNRGYHKNCEYLSNGTSGSFVSNITGASDLNAWWLKIYEDFADLHNITNKTFSTSSGFDFLVDPTVQSGVVEVRYALQSANSYCTFGIGKNGTPIPSTTTVIPLSNTSSYPQEQIALVSFDNSAVAGAGQGIWNCYVNSSGLVSNNLKGKVIVKGKPEGTYSVVTGNHQNGFYTWPEPLRLSASTTGPRGLITGLDMTATLTTPSGSIINVILNDNGVNGDRIANDGIYSLDYQNYTENGQYTLSVEFTNSSGNAYYAIEGVYRSIPESGVVVDPDIVFVAESFVRTRSTVFHVSEVNAPLPTRTGSIMGFESDTLWSILYSSGTLSSSGIRTEGSASLQISGNGWQQIKSRNINTDELQNVTNKVSVDLFMGNTQTNPYWTGQVQLFVNCPSANIYNQHIESIDLTGLPLDMFSTLSFTLPQDVFNVLNGSYSDFSFSLSINTNANTGVYYFDNLRFGN